MCKVCSEKIINSLLDSNICICYPNDCEHLTFKDNTLLFTVSGIRYKHITGTDKEHKVKFTNDSRRLLMSSIRNQSKK